MDAHANVDANANVGVCVGASVDVDTSVDGDASSYVEANVGVMGALALRVRCKGRMRGPPAVSTRQWLAKLGVVKLVWNV